MQDRPLKYLHIAFIVCLFLYATVQVLKFIEYSANSFIFNYLNDLLVIPIVAFICLNALWYLKKDFSIRLSIISLISLTLLYSVYFEIYLPNHHERYTADVWDVVCYITGALMFYVLQKLP